LLPYASHNIFNQNDFVKSTLFISNKNKISYNLSGFYKNNEIKNKESACNLFKHFKMSQVVIATTIMLAIHVKQVVIRQQQRHVIIVTPDKRRVTHTNLLIISRVLSSQAHTKTSPSISTTHQRPTIHGRSLGTIASDRPAQLRLGFLPESCPISASSSNITPFFFQYKSLLTTG
jgi:hypothetical protein